MDVVVDADDIAAVAADVDAGVDIAPEIGAAVQTVADARY